MFGREPQELTTDEIEKIAVGDGFTLEEYASNIVSYRSNTFSMKKYDDLDKKIDESLKQPKVLTKMLSFLPKPRLTSNSLFKIKKKQ